MNEKLINRRLALAKASGSYKDADSIIKASKKLEAYLNEAIEVNKEDDDTVTITLRKDMTEASATNSTPSNKIEAAERTLYYKSIDESLKYILGRCKDPYERLESLIEHGSPIQTISGSILSKLTRRILIGTHRPPRMSLRTIYKAILPCMLRSYKIDASTLCDKLGIAEFSLDGYLSIVSSLMEYDGLKLERVRFKKHEYKLSCITPKSISKTLITNEN